MITEQLYKEYINKGEYMKGSKLAAQVVYEQKRNKFWKEKVKRIKGGRKMKVKATGEYQKRNLTDAVLGRTPKEGEEFEVTEERFKVLSGNNPFKAIFVKAVEEKKEIEVAKKEPKTEKAVKKTTKKAK